MPQAPFAHEDALKLLASLQAAGALIARFASADASASPLHDALGQRAGQTKADLHSLQLDLVQLLSMQAAPDVPHVVAQISVDATPRALAIGPTIFPDRESAEETIAAFGSRRKISGLLAFPMPAAFVAYLPQAPSP